VWKNDLRRNFSNKIKLQIGEENRVEVGALKHRSLAQRVQEIFIMKFHRFDKKRLPRMT
jgi:aromatic ring-cleaving dioxygenase